MASTPGARICDLPCEVLVSIFSSLSVADVAHCAAVCERWHAVVTSFTQLWKDKAYRSDHSPRECAETRAVMRALPPLQEVTIKLASHFTVDLSFPRLVLSVAYVRVVKDCPVLRCKFLATTVHIAGYILSHRSTIHFEGLQRLWILRTWTPNLWVLNDYSADYVVHTAMNICPTLKHLKVCTEFVSAANLDVVEGFSQLQTLEISCFCLQKLSFLRLCSDALEELKLVGCDSMLSRELAELRRLRNLRKLRLTDWRFEEGDLASAVAGLGNLESLQLECCSVIRDLSMLRQCGRLQELRITYSPLQDCPQTVALDGPQLQLHDLRLSSNVDLQWVGVVVVHVPITADDLSAALSRLEEVGMTSSCLAYMGALRHCSQLRSICCEFVRGLKMLNVRINITLTGCM